LKSRALRSKVAGVSFFVRLFFALMTLSAAAATSSSKVIRVACVGDSITQGSGLADPATESYPAQLAKLLGAGYLVGNFGLSGSTLLQDGDLPYRKQPTFTAALAFAPDVVVISLGTNDTKPQNWQHAAAFAADYRALIAAFRALPSQPKIFLCQPMPVFPPGDWGISPELMAGPVHRLVAQLAAEEKCGLIDLHTPMLAHREFVPDTVHPDARGAGVLAKTVGEAVSSKR
jgi:lysophospholipase L1-like esterase